MEAKGNVKDVGRAVLGLPKDPQPQTKINERGWVFLSWLSVASLFRVPFLEPFFNSFWTNFGGHFREFFQLFSLLGVTWSKQRF